MAVVHTTAGGVHRTLGGGALPIPKQPLFRALARRCLTTPQKGVVTFTHAAGAANVTTSSPHNLSRPSGDLREPNNLGRPQESPLRRQTSENRAVLGRVWGPQGRGAQVFAGAPGAQSAAVLPPTAAAAAAGRPHGPSAQSSWRNARRSSPGNPRRPPAARMACRLCRLDAARAQKKRGSVYNGIWGVGLPRRPIFSGARSCPRALRANNNHENSGGSEYNPLSLRWGLLGGERRCAKMEGEPQSGFSENGLVPGKGVLGPTPHASETDPTWFYTSFWAPTAPNITLFRPAAGFLCMLRIRVAPRRGQGSGVLAQRRCPPPPITNTTCPKTNTTCPIPNTTCPIWSTG